MSKFESPLASYPVSPEGRPPNTMMRSYGTQSPRVWVAGDTREQQLLDGSTLAEFFYRVSVTGDNALLRLVYGTASTIELDGILLPFAAAIPGRFALYARPELAAAAAAYPTLTASSGEGGTVRTEADATAGAVAIPSSARRLTALGVGSVTVRGVAVALAAGDTLDVAHPATLTAGVALLEHVL